MFVMAAKSSPRSRLTGHRDITCYISYSRQDGAAYTVALSRHLQQDGVRTLLDTENSAGSRWVDALQEIRNHADVLILVATPSALTSSFVLAEVRHFLDRGGRTVRPGSDVCARPRGARGCCLRAHVV